jgi:hypothetical protein
MGWATFWVIFSQTHLVTLYLSKEENKAQQQNVKGTWGQSYDHFFSSIFLQFSSKHLALLLKKCDAHFFCLNNCNLGQSHNFVTIFSAEILLKL